MVMQIGMPEHAQQPLCASFCQRRRSYGTKIAASQVERLWGPEWS